MVYLALSPRAARVLDEAISFAESYSPTELDPEILEAIQKDMKEQLTPIKPKGKKKPKSKRRK